MIRNYLQAILFSCCAAFAGLAELVLRMSRAASIATRPYADSPVHAVFNSVHGNLNGGGASTCTACHGPLRSPPIAGADATTLISVSDPRGCPRTSEQNASCLGCHEETGGKLLLAGQRARAGKHGLHRLSQFAYPARPGHGAAIGWRPVPGLPQPPARRAEIALAPPHCRGQDRLQLTATIPTAAAPSLPCARSP